VDCYLVISFAGFESDTSFSTLQKMAVQRILFAVGLLQVITSLCSIALCTRHYSDTKDMQTNIAHISVMFTVRCLPSLSLLVCGIIGIIISCIGNETLRIVHTTVTVQTTIGIAVNIWFFAYQSGNSPVKYDHDSARKCLIAAIFCLITCLVYITYLVIGLCRSISDSGEEKLKITDVESATTSSYSKSEVKQPQPKNFLQVPEAKY